MLLNKLIQRDYTSFSRYYQIKLPLDLEISIPSDDPVRLVSAFVEEMDLSELYKTYDRFRKNQATPRQMLKLVIYAAMNRIYSSRDIQKACKRDINFMYLLEGMPAPDHATIARFISLHFSACAKVLLAQMSDLLYLLGEISGKTIFIDGTKIESAANKYTFVWKRAITKNQARLYTKLSSFVAECEELYGIRNVYHDQISIHTLKRLKKQLCRIKVQEGIVFVHGIGRRKTQLQKSLEKLKEYTKKLYILIISIIKHFCRQINSFSNVCLCLRNWRVDNKKTTFIHLFGIGKNKIYLHYLILTAFKTLASNGFLTAKNHLYTA